MKRTIKITSIVAAVVVALVLIAAFAISPFAKYYIEKNSKELVGRQINMSALRLNIFTGSLEIDSLKMFEADDKVIFASVDTFKMNLEILKLLSKDVVVTNIRIIDPYATIWQKGDLFNFTDLMTSDSTAAPADTATSGFPRNIILQNIYIAGGKLVYTDKLLDNTMRFKDLGVEIPEIQFGNGNTKAGIHLKMGEQASLTSRMAMNMKTNDYELMIQLDKLPLSIIKPYLKSYYEVNTLTGLVNSNIKISGNTNHIMDFIVSGTANAQNVVVTNKLNEPVISGGNAAIDIRTIDLTRSQYLFRSMVFTGVDLYYIMHPKTDNITTLYPPVTAATTTATAQEPPMVFRTGLLSVRDSRITFVDKTLRKPFALKMHGVELTSENYDLDGTNLLKGLVLFENNGRLLYSWKGNINDLKSQDLYLKMVNFNLQSISPYCYHYTAYDLTSGKLNFETKNKITNYNINSTNVIDVYNPNLSKKYKDFKPEYNYPLRTGLYILKDKNDKVNFVVPVTGNINDPKFSYWRIAFKTLGNLMVKVATAPFKFLGDALGLGDKGGLESLPVDAYRNGFSAEDYARIDDLLNTLSAKPELSLQLAQYINYDSELPGYTLYRARERFLNRSGGNASFDEVMALSNSDKQFEAYIDSITLGRIDPKSSVRDKIATLFVSDSLRAELTRKMNFRNDVISRYIAASGKVKDGKLTVTNAAPDSLAGFSGAPRYKVRIGIEGD